MPSSTLPSSFASAAAGGNGAGGGSGGAESFSGRTPRGEGAGFGDWSRPRNGATQTFRRSSNAPVSHQRESSSTASTSLSHQRNGAVVDTRYSKDQLLDLYREQRSLGDLDGAISHLYVGDMDISAAGTHINGQGQSRWSRRDDSSHEAAPSADICWDRNLFNEPLALTDMTDEEREALVTSVNSPLKAPNANPSAREGQAARKMSQSQGTQPAASASRPSARRRDLSESFITSPRRDDAAAAAAATTHSPPPPSLMRRRTDTREGSSGGFDDQSAFSSGLKRVNTSNFGSLAPNGPTSPWSTTAPQNPAGGPGGGPLGSFGNFALVSNPIERARPGPTRAESRFKGLMSRDSTDDVHSVGEKASRGSLARVEEAQYDARGAAGPVGSAALGGESPLQSSSTTSRNFADYISPQRPQQTAEHHGFGADAAHPSYSNSQQTDTSPTFTNPYHSPSQNASRLDEPEDNSADAAANSQYHLPGLGGGFGRHDSHAAFHDRMASGFDRTQTASAFAAKPFAAFPGLGGLGGLGGGSADGSNLRSPGAIGSIGRGNSRLGSLFPSGGVQDQLRPVRSMESDGQGKTDENAPPFTQAFGQAPGRDTGSPFRGGRGKFDDFFGAVDKQAEYQAGQSQPLGSIGQQHVPQRMPSNVTAASSSSATMPAERDPPAAQQKTMVMPDRIRWIYRDPQGNTQGPWTGLEMHDWYRAGFFSPELLVKKYEDQDYEPLAQLIRRIGNSREPFLVPQIGIPAPVSAQQAGAVGAGGGAAASTGGAAASSSSSSAAAAAAAQSWPAQGGAGAPQAQPPFANSFPSFGTTLTAEQQNALERRKQEEQYLMARQKEHLAQQQIMVKQLQAQGLQHHSSAQSLHSQTSYGSITSPTAYNAQLMQGLAQAHVPSAAPSASVGFDSTYRGMAPIGSGIDTLGHIKEEETSSLMERLSIGNEKQQQQQQQQQHPQAVAQALADRARLQQEQAEEQEAHHEQFHANQQRLQQFHSLQTDKLQDESKTQPSAEPRQTQRDLTLTEQVQKAASAKQSPAAGPSPWTSDKDEAAPVAPPQSSSPLPAPAARRNQKHVAEQLTAESISQSASPSLETPSASVAPWAKEASETQKQPSLKEIQEAEARRAAKQEEVMAAARRAALERDIAAAQAATVPTPGLPTSSTWGSAESPLATTGSPWATKAPAGKSATPSNQTKKTLQQIQKEEEALARKQKAALLAAQGGLSSPGIQTLSSGKRYADLASKVSAPANNVAAGSGWSTVGAGGKAKPPPVTSPTGTLHRTASGSAATRGAQIISKPAPPTRSVTSSAATTSNPAADAMDSFRRWAIAELRPDLNKGVEPAMFVNEILLNLPVDSVAEAVHQSSLTLDSRHFAEEFVRRRVLAEKGKTLPAGGATAASSTAALTGASNGTAASSQSGWSEVARKGPTKSASATPAVEDGGMFKVVPAKKRGGSKR